MICCLLFAVRYHLLARSLLVLYHTMSPLERKKFVCPTVPRYLVTVCNSLLFVITIVRLNCEITAHHLSFHPTRQYVWSQL